MLKEFRVNERIRAREVRVIEENGAQLGVMSVRDALSLARGRDLDLIEVAPTAVPPVCRVMDYGKYKYEQAKKERDNRKKQKPSDIRPVRIRSSRIDDHDFAVKLRMMRRFLEEGSKVKVNLMFRGREMTHPEIGRKVCDRVAQEMAELAQVEKTPSFEGRIMTMVLSPKPQQGQQKNAQTANAQVSG